MLSASVPKHKSKAEKEEDKKPKTIFDIIGNGG
jgi:hypothetical protein